MSASALLALHPWPAPWADKRHLERLWVYDLPGTPESLWPFLSDTSRMNRALGTAEMTFEERDGKRWGTATQGGVRHEWVEQPWNWVANQWLSSLREYKRGFFQAVWAVQRLESTPTGTRLYLYFGTVPRGAFAAFAIRLGFPSIKRAYDRVLPALAAQLDRLRPDILQLPPTPLAPAAVQRLAAAREQLVRQGLPLTSVTALLDWIRTGDDQDLHRIQIRERARVWQLPETDLLRVALHATRAGLLTLSWDTVCPHCRGVADERGALSQVEGSSHCSACDTDFTTEVQERVEVTFHVHPSIRDVPVQLYCSAEPARKDHIRVQRTLQPGEVAVIAPRLRPGRYIAKRNFDGGWYLDIGDDAVEPMAVTNPAPQPTVFTIEEARWSDHALRAGQLLSIQEFRDLFSEEYIGSDVRLGVGEQTLLFTDVVGSTAFYAQRGDPAAFMDIKRHFDEVFAIVTEHRGAVVKTIGDAVMATFGDPLDAVRASQKIHDAFHPSRADTPIRLRISLNTGPCIAVRLNANADFFGGTVNLAAKLQAMAGGHQIAMSEATYRSAGVAEFLASEAATIDELVYTSKALTGPVAVRRWTVHR